MGVVTVTMDNKTEEIFRKAVKEKFGEGKGVLAKGIDEAVRQWLEETREEQLKQRFLARLKKGHKMGKILYKHRDELYDR
ncbi:MAG TPA: hypothetical protein VJK05_03850 [archaeon]|nr:hypothetical protein [archaeon]